MECPTSKKVSTREDQPSTRRARFDGQARNNCKNDIVLPGVEQSAEQRWRDAVEQSPQSICKFLGAVQEEEKEAMDVNIIKSPPRASGRATNDSADDDDMRVLLFIAKIVQLAMTVVVMRLSVHLLEYSLLFLYGCSTDNTIHSKYLHSLFDSLIEFVWQNPGEMSFR